MKKWVWVVLIVLVLGIIVGALVYRARRDALPPQDDDLQVQRLEIPDKENAFRYFGLAGKKLKWPEDEATQDSVEAMLSQEEWDAELAARLLQQNAKALEHFDRGLACSRCQVPEPQAIADIFPYLQKWRRFAQLGSLRALWLVKQGPDREAADEAMKVVRFGHMVEGSGGGLIHWLVGCAIKAIGTDSLRHVAAEMEAEPSLLLKYADDLEQYGADEKGLQDAWRVEYAMSAKMVDDLATGKLDIGDLAGGGQASPARGYTGFLFRPNKTKQIFARGYRTYVENAPRTYD
ncbi:MAG: hypothetical protein ACYS8L_02735, partial [Planctomycetota bacterium]